MVGSGIASSKKFSLRTIYGWERTVAARKYIIVF